MSSAAQTLLERFEALNPADRKEVAAEILRRSLATEALEDAELRDVAVAIFQSYDTEEAKRGES